jgi:predicted regulator of Ras-like GTPase activity (Roadblock/LC7/MglB family)/response regulator of citrate/malate metabolism
MSNKILLVDDEKTLLQSIKKGLAHLSDTVTTDICFSVSDAIKQIEAVDYDLIVTDIRMPFKSGIDLLLYLKMNDFSGGIKVMSAYTTEENLKKINSLGIIDVIPKPFDFEWFEEMIIDFFKKKKEAAVTFESIDLLSVMQVINLDRKTSALQIEGDGLEGVIYFVEGEIIDAEYQGLRGEAAVLKLIAQRKRNISVKKIKNNVKKTIDVPFVEFMLDAMKKIDEYRNGDKGGKEEKENVFILKNKNEEENMKFEKDVLTVLNRDIEGLLAASIFGRDGIPILIENPGKLDVDGFSAKFAMVSALANKSIKELSGGKVTEILVEEENGWVLVRPMEKAGTFLIVAVSSRATLGNVRFVAKRLVAELENMS